MGDDKSGGDMTDMSRSNTTMKEAVHEKIGNCTVLHYHRNHCLFIHAKERVKLNQQTH